MIGNRYNCRRCDSCKQNFPIDFQYCPYCKRKLIDWIEKEIAEIEL